MAKTAVVGTIAVNLVANTGQFSIQMQSARAQLQAFTGNVPKALNGLGALGLGFLSVTAAVRGFVGAFTAMFQQALEFERASRLGTELLENLSAEQMETLQQSARQVAFAFGMSSNEIMASFHELSSAGLDFNQVLKTMPIMALFAKGAHMEMGEAIEQVTTAMGALGLKSKDAAELQANMAMTTGMLAKANALANGQIRDFTAGLVTNSATIAGQMGMSIEETIASLTVLHEKGIMADESGTKLMMTIRDLSMKSIKHAEVWEQHLDVYDKATGQFRGLAAIMTDLDAIMANMTQRGQNEFLAELKINDKSVHAVRAFMKEGAEISKRAKELAKDPLKYLRELVDKGIVPLDLALGQLKVMWQQASSSLFAGMIKHAGEALLTFNANLVSAEGNLTKFLFLLGAGAAGAFLAVTATALLTLMIGGLVLAVMALNAALGLTAILTAPILIIFAVIAALGAAAGVMLAAAAINKLKSELDAMYKGITEQLEKQKAAAAAAAEEENKRLAILRQQEEMQRAINDLVEQAKKIEEKYTSNYEKAYVQLARLAKMRALLNDENRISAEAYAAEVNEIVNNLMKAEMSAENMNRSLNDNAGISAFSHEGFNAANDLAGELQRRQQIALQRKAAEIQAKMEEHLKDIREHLKKDPVTGQPITINVPIQQANF